METLAYTHAALEYEISLSTKRQVQKAPRRHRRLTLQRVFTAATLALTVMVAGIAGTILSPIGVEATRNLPR